MDSHMYSHLNPRESMVSQADGDHRSSGKPWVASVYRGSSWKETETVFMSSHEVTARIEVGSHLSRAPVSNALYLIHLEHGPYSWVVKKRFHNFTLLHAKLALHRQAARIKHGVLRGLRSVVDVDQLPQLPKFPGRPDTMVTDLHHLEERRVALEEYINQVLQYNRYRELAEMQEFLEASPMSFVTGASKGKEGKALKRRGDDRPGGICHWTHCVRAQRAFCACLPGQWNTRWLMVQDTFMMYVNPAHGTIKTVVLFDEETEIKCGFKLTGARKGLVVRNLSRSLYLRFKKVRWMEDWQEYIEGVLQNGDAKLLTSSAKRFGSFAPERTGSASWFVDGEDYMSSVADAIVQAREEIFITDWWLSPEVYLKRDPCKTKWRLDCLLQEKAQSGVKVFILLYKEVEAILNIKSVHSKRHLQGLQNANIRVIRHPDHVPLPIMWAHHEKLVIIDQKCAFVSGIDLCFGRWDNFRHKLKDVGHANNSKSDVDGPVEGSDQTNLDKSIVNSSRPCIRPVFGRTITTLLLNTQDMAMLPVRATESKDEDQEKENKTLKKSARSVMLKLKTMKKMRDSTEDLSKEGKDVLDGGGLSKVSMEDLLSPEVEVKWPGKDFVNFIVKDVMEPELYQEENSDRGKTVRMPWHDIGVVVQGVAAKDVARHFIQRWNHLKTEKLKFNSNYPFLIPKSYSCDNMDLVPRLLPTLHNVKCQVVRSSSTWSAGQDKVEHSIHLAMINTIENAKHYVYIENQFLISVVKKAGEVPDVQNDIATAIYNRIVKASEAGETFRVFFLLPLLPAIEGDVAGESGAGMRTIMHYQYRSMNRGPQSIISSLMEAGVLNWRSYIGFFSLRSHDELMDVPVTELIYIHSKLLIADDNVVICGSANINDRSLLGDRDSEVCLYIQDEEFVSGKMNGAAYQAGKFASSLRKHLFCEHLGLLTKNKKVVNTAVDDPVSDNFYHDVWEATAEKNTQIFDELFSVLPSDHVETRKKCREIQKGMRPVAETLVKESKIRVTNIKGHLVNFPLNFLCNEDLAPAISSKEGLVSADLWK